MFSLLFTPIGRYAILAVLAISVAAYGIHAIKKQAVAEIEAKATADALRRTQDAIRAGDGVDISPDRVRESDGHRRD